MALTTKQKQDMTAALAETEKKPEIPPLAERMREFKNIEVINEGTQIILPAVPSVMDYETGAAWLLAKKEEEESKVAIYEIIEGVPLDAAHAFTQSLKKRFGWIKMKPESFLWISRPPKMLGVTVDPDGSTVQVPWGQFELPGIDGYLQTQSIVLDGQVKLLITGEVKHKHKDAVNALLQDARVYLKAHSIYRGMAVKVKFEDLNDDDTPNPLRNQPQFIKTADIRPEELIFNQDVEDLMEVNLWAILKHMDAVRRAQVPIKRGILLHGIPGVGKTLTALATARLAVQHNVTFVEVGDPTQLTQAIEFARKNAPAVVFVEDIDRLDKADNNVYGGRSDSFNQILNTVDGLTGKDEEIIVVFTTNHVERIHPTMLRPGRLDAVIEIEPPDPSSVERLIRMYSRGLLHKDEDLKAVGVVLRGEIPATIREVVERAKLTAIVRGEVHKITGEDLRISAVGMRKHLDLLKPKVEDTRSNKELAAAILGEAIERGVAAYVAAQATAKLLAEEV